MILRKARLADAPAIAALMRRSIYALCTEDHKNEPAILAKWADSKTPELLASWIDAPSSTIMVAEEDDQLLSVGSISRDGEIGLNYIEPTARFRGISRAMIEKLESIAAQQGNTHCSLASTGTARRFYLALGYREEPSIIGMFGNVVYPMSKTL